MNDTIDWTALLALEGQATAGPWWDDVGEKVTSVEAKYQTVACDVTNADAAFIAASRQAVPALVALVRGLARALDDAAHRFGEIFEAARGEFIQSAATNGEQAALMALATIPAALRAGVGDGE